MIASWCEFAVSGAVLSYGPSRILEAKRLAGYVEKVLNGAKPADLPTACEVATVDRNRMLLIGSAIVAIHRVHDAGGCWNFRTVVGKRSCSWG